MLHPIFTADTRDTPLEKRLLPRMSTYIRTDANNLPPMRLTDRDKYILEAVHAYDGLLSDRQIQQLFFSGRTATQVRLMLLFQHGYLNRPNRKQRAALSSMVYWLGDKGAALVAGLEGLSLEEFSWRKEPRWSQVEHDLAVNDIRISLYQACQQQTDFQLEEWLPTAEFHAHPDKVDYSLPNGTRTSRYIRPDGFCVLSKANYTSRLLIELDCATEDNARLAREKILPGIAYIRSDAYKRRFGFSSGRWLFITTSERRLKNMKRATERAAGNDAKLFYFTTMNRLTSETVLTAPIWYRGGEATPVALFPN